MNESDQPPDQRKYLVAGLVSLFPALVHALAGRAGWDHDIVDLLSMAATIPVLFHLLPEPLRLSRLSLALLLAGIVVGGLSFWLRYRNHLHDITMTGDNGLLGVAIYLVVMVVLVPLWEEKACRQVLFFGIGRYTGLWLSALLVSAVFAWTHHGNGPFAFAFSLAACVLAAKGVSSFDRAFLHAGTNLAQVLPWLYFGYKF